LKHSVFNDGMRYLLTCIDVFSKRAWAEPIRTKSARVVADAYYFCAELHAIKLWFTQFQREIFERSNRKTEPQPFCCSVSAGLFSVVALNLECTFWQCFSID